jgi:hypothetical protein
MSSCAGIHCAGCLGGAALPVVPLLELCGAAWVAGHIIEVAAVSGACGALAVSAVVALMRWADRRDERQRGAASIWTAREAPPITHVRAESVTSAERPALGFRDLHVHLDGLADAEQVQVIRRALGDG